jgi:hypothetical protein
MWQTFFLLAALAPGPQNYAIWCWFNIHHWTKDQLANETGGLERPQIQFLVCAVRISQRF